MFAMFAKVSNHHYLQPIIIKKILKGSGLTQWERAIANPKEKVKIQLIIIIIIIIIMIFADNSFKSLFQVVMQHTLMNSRSGFNSET